MKVHTPEYEKTESYNIIHYRNVWTVTISGIFDLIDMNIIQL